MKKHEKLSPCPICKGRAILRTLPNGKFVIQCSDCKISTQQLENKDYLIYCWENLPYG